MIQSESLEDHAPGQSPYQTQGSIIIAALITIAILSLVLATGLQLVVSKYNTVYQAASWQEAIVSAESGADIAMASLRQSRPAASHPSRYCR